MAVLSGIPHSVRILVELISFLARQQKWYHYLQQAEFDSIYSNNNYIPYTSTLVVYSSLYLLVEYCTFVYNILLLYTSLYLLSTTVGFM